MLLEKKQIPFVASKFFLSAIQCVSLLIFTVSYILYNILYNIFHYMSVFLSIRSVQPGDHPDSLLWLPPGQSPSLHGAAAADPSSRRSRCPHRGLWWPRSGRTWNLNWWWLSYSFVEIDTEFWKKKKKKKNIWHMSHMRSVRNGVTKTNLQRVQRCLLLFVVRVEG